MRHQNEERLFSYGTLQSEAVQIETFGRKLSGSAGALIGYRLVMVRIEDQEFAAKSGTADHRNLKFTGDDADLVEGTVLTLTIDELQQADAYEPQNYDRIRVQLKSGTSAWVYIAHQQI